MLKNILNLNGITILDKKAQKNISGSIFSGGDESSECLFTGCFSDGFVGFEGGPCGLETPASQACIGTVRNGQCCIGFPPF